MNFIVSSTGLLSHLQSISRVINSKNTLPILDNFLFELSNKELIVTASDLETTLNVKINLQNAEGDGKIAIDAKKLNDIIKEFSEQPLSFNIDNETLNVEIVTDRGKFNIKGYNADEFPQVPTIKKDKEYKIELESEVLLTGINKAHFATANDDLRPVMNGIYIEINNDFFSFVASDGHKLVRYRRYEINSPEKAAFILPKKPASLLKNILTKVQGVVTLQFDDKNAFFSFTDYNMVCRLVEGKYPNYNHVIPTNNNNRLIVDRVDLLNSIKRASIFANQASNLVKIKIAGNQLSVSAQDLDFASSAYEQINCQYEGEDMEIGFKSLFLLEILSNLSSSDIKVELSDPSRAGLLMPTEKEVETEDTLMLLMPMMINN